MPDSDLREMAIQGATIALLLWLGLYPQVVIETARPAFEALQRLAGR